MLLFAADHPVLPVDARVSRVGRRLGYGDARRRFPEAGALGPATRSPASFRRRSPAFRRAFLYLSHHGGATCTESDPHCAVCPLLKDCPGGTRDGSGSGLTIARTDCIDPSCEPISVQRSDPLAERLDVLPDLLVLFPLARRRASPTT